MSIVIYNELNIDVIQLNSSIFNTFNSICGVIGSDANMCSLNTVLNINFLNSLHADMLILSIKVIGTHPTYNNSEKHCEHIRIYCDDSR